MLIRKMQRGSPLAFHGPMMPLQPPWPCLPGNGKEGQQDLEPAQVPSPVTGAVAVSKTWGITTS